MILSHSRQPLQNIRVVIEVLGPIGGNVAQATDEDNIGPLSDRVPFLDEETRPKAAPIPGATPAQRARGQRLRHYHRHHLNELAAVRVALDRLMSGVQDAGSVSKAISSLSMVENYRAVGNLCGTQCQLLQMHHDIEEDEMYPVLWQSEGLRPVLERLRAEHRTVHALLERIQAMANALSLNPSREAIVALSAVYETFERTVLSHFGYEERELEEAIGYYGAL